MAGPAIMQDGFRRALRRERIFRDRENHLEFYNEDELYTRYRFGRRNILFIFGLLKNEITHPTKRSLALPPLLQLLICLRFLGCGSFLTVVGDTMPRVSNATVCRCVRRVCVAMHALMPELIQMPGDARIPLVKGGFYDLAGEIITRGGVTTHICGYGC